MLFLFTLIAKTTAISLIHPSHPSQTFSIGGLFPIHEKAKGVGAHQCGKIMERRGIQRQEAMLFAIDQINRNSTLLPGITLSALILDTCADPIYALNQSLLYVRDLMGNMDMDRYACLDGSLPELRSQRQPVAGVIGEAYSDVTIQTANLLKLFGIVQISPASTSAVLSDKHRYYYFARTVPSDNFQAKALAEFAHEMNWTYVSIVYSSGDYGEKGAEEFKKAARSLNICIALDETMPRHEDLKSIVANLRRMSEKDLERKVGARVVILFTSNLDTRRLLRAVAEAARTDVWPEPNLVWLAADGWEMSADTTRGAESVSQGSITTSLRSSRVAKFEKYFKSLHPSNYTSNARNPWFKEFWEERFNCSLRSETMETFNNRQCDLNSQSLQNMKEFDDKIEFVIDAVYALAIALDDMQKDICVNRESTSLFPERGACPEMNTYDRELFGEILYKKYLMNVNFTGTSGMQFRFDSQGDGPASYEIKNYHWNERTNKGKYETIGSWDQGKLIIHQNRIWWTNRENATPFSRCSAECPTGQVKRVQAGDTCCWVCVPCKDNEFVIDDYTCQACQEGYYPEADRLSCYEMSQRHLDYMRWESAYSIAPSVLAALGINLTLFVIVVFAIYNDTPVVKASGRELSYMMLAGMLICYLMTFVVLAKPTEFTCGLKRVGVGVGFAVLYAAMLVKTNRIYRIFASAKAGACRPRFISPYSQVIITVLLVNVQVVGSIIWSIWDRPTTRFAYIDPPQVVLKCKIDDSWFLLSLVYDIILIVMCTVYAIRTRMVPENFNETKFIGFTMYTTCIIWLAFIPIYFGTGNNFKIQTTTLCISVTLSATVALVCLYSPKIWIIFLEPEKNVRKPQGQFMNSSQPAVPNNLHQNITGAYSSPPSVYSPLVPKTSSATSASVTDYKEREQLRSMLSTASRTSRGSRGSRPDNSIAPAPAETSVESSDHLLLTNKKSGNAAGDLILTNRNATTISITPPAKLETNLLAAAMKEDLIESKVDDSDEESLTSL